MKVKIPQNFGGNNNMNNVIKQAQKVQDEVARIQEELDEKEYAATAGGGAVEVVIKGSREVLAINIKPEVVDPEDIEMLQDLLIAATNEALRKIEEESSDAMQQATGGLSIPGLI